MYIVIKKVVDLTDNYQKTKDVDQESNRSSGPIFY